MKSGADRYYPKVYCPKCDARLMDIRSDNLEYKAVVEQMGNRDQFDFSMKCPKCKSIVGIAFERKRANISFRTEHGVPVPVIKAAPTPYQIVILGAVSA